MKVFSALVKVLTALAAVAGAVYVIATYGDQIVAWAKGLMAKCPCCCEDAPVEKETVEEITPVEEPAEDVPAEEPAPVAEEVPAEEAVPDDGVPVADEDDFEG